MLFDLSIAKEPVLLKLALVPVPSAEPFIPLPAKVVTVPDGVIFLIAYSDETVHPIPGQTEQLFL